MLISSGRGGILRGTIDGGKVKGGDDFWVTGPQSYTSGGTVGAMGAMAAEVVAAVVVAGVVVAAAAAAAAAEAAVPTVRRLGRSGSGTASSCSFALTLTAYNNFN